MKKLIFGNKSVTIAGKFVLKVGIYLGTYWAIATIIDKPAFPPLQQVLSALVEDRGQIISVHAKATLPRWAEVYAIGTIFGVVAGLVLGLPRKYHDLVATDIDFFRSLPATALLTFTLALMNHDLAVLFPAFYITFFTVLYWVVKHTRILERGRIEHLRDLGASWSFVVFNCIIPELADPLLLSARQAISLSFLVLISIEMFIGTSDGQGLGSYLYDQTYFLKYDVKWAALVYIGILGFILNFLGHQLHRYSVRWKEVD